MKTDDLVALRKEVLKIYAEAPMRPLPYFPPAPQQFLDPEEYVEQLADAVLLHSPKIIHPFSLKFVRGEWTKRQLQEWAKEGFHDKIQTIRNDAMIVATAPTLEEMKKQASVVASEAGVDGVGDSHPELWLRFGEGLGLTREEVAKSTPTALTQVVLDAERYRSMSQRIGGLPANMRMGERVSSIVYPIWGHTLMDKYGLTRDDVIFFMAHEEADDDHSEIGRQVVMSRGTTFEAQQDIWQHHADSQAKQWISYDGYYHAVVSRAPSAEPVAA